MIDPDIKFSYKIESVGMTTVDDFNEVICEIRYHFVGSLNGVTKERFYVQKIDISNLSAATFKNSVDVSRDKLVEWLVDSINPENFQDMKQSMHEQFHPKVQYVSPLYFREKCRS